MPTPDMETVTKVLSTRPMKMPSFWQMFKMSILRLPPSAEEIFAFFFWIKHVAHDPSFTPQQAVELSFDKYQPSAEVLRAYAAPFPGGDNAERFMAGARRFPSLVPLLSTGGVRGSPDDVTDNKQAWEVFSKWEKPWLT